jgi:hypothetical protein
MAFSSGSLAIVKPYIQLQMHDVTKYHKAAAQLSQHEPQQPSINLINNSHLRADSATIKYSS